MSDRIRKAIIRHIRAGSFVRYPHGNNPEAHIVEMIKWLSLKPGTDIEYMFHHGFMIVSTYSTSEKQWIHRFCDSSSVHNIHVMVRESEL